MNAVDLTYLAQVIQNLDLSRRGLDSETRSVIDEAIGAIDWAREEIVHRRSQLERIREIAERPIPWPLTDLGALRRALREKEDAR